MNKGPEKCRCRVNTDEKSQTRTWPNHVKKKEIYVRNLAKSCR